MTAHERQSAASAAREFRDSFEMSLGGPMFAATDDAQLERIAGWFERDLAQLLESRERPLLEQVSALREALEMLTQGEELTAHWSGRVRDARAALAEPDAQGTLRG